MCVGTSMSGRATTRSEWARSEIAVVRPYVLSPAAVTLHLTRTSTSCELLPGRASEPGGRVVADDRLSCGERRQEPGW
jgi:hypothetical protein